MSETLPIDALLEPLVEALRRGPTAILSAPPGAGKTTRVPPVLLRAGLVDGQIIVLQPRRLAARAVAGLMARQMGEPLGRTVGYRVRFEERLSAATRILVVTEGVLTRRLLGDPLLEGVGCVVLDEFHERSVDADLCLAFLRELLEVRRDLKLVVMSATLEATPLQTFLGGCPHLHGELRGYPLDIRYDAQPDRRPLPQRIRSGLLRLLADQRDDGGDMLVFLPGAGEIRAALALLEEQPLPGTPELVPLYGALPPDQQDRIFQRGSRRRIVLATNIAETSLTVPGVTAVVDSGLVRRLRYDARLGLDGLELGHISQASAEQRAGRAGRLSPGRALRLWTAAEQAGLPAAETPEIRRVDPAPVLLSTLAFHPGDPNRFEYLEAPSPADMEAGLTLLRQLRALPHQGFSLTDRGRRLARWPLHPRLGAMLEAASAGDLFAEGALLAALLGERDLLRTNGAGETSHDSDLLHRRDLFLALKAAHFSPEAARRLGLDERAAREVERAREQLARLASPSTRTCRPEMPDERGLLRLPLAGYPDRLCRRRAAGSLDGIMVGGRGVRLDERSGVRRAALFLALEIDAGRPGLHAVSRVRQASAVDEAMLEERFTDEMRLERSAYFDERQGAVRATERRMYQDLVLAEREVPPQADEAGQLLAAAALARFAEAVKPDDEGLQLIARLRLARRHLPEESWPGVDDAGLRRLLAELCTTRRSLDDLARVDWADELRRRLDRRLRGLLERELPERLEVPSGSQVRVDYAAGEKDDAPVLAVKLQELFGLAETPRLARGRLPVVLHLLAPNGRPVQITRDLHSFWEHGYAEVRRTLRGRYPKHPWPEDPWSSPPTRGTKRNRR